MAGAHALSPEFLKEPGRDQPREPRRADHRRYYLHNPETQLAAVGRSAFLARLREAFECLEALVESGKIRFYGTATWSGYRSKPRTKDWLSLEEMVAVAHEAGGEGHRFRFVQAPYNLAMTIFSRRRTNPWQTRWCRSVSRPSRSGVNLVSSASIAQGRLKSGLPEWLGTLFRGASSDAQRALQFARSTPGVSVALVGMKTAAHVQENLGTARIPPAPVEDFLKLFEVK